MNKMLNRILERALTKREYKKLPENMTDEDAIEMIVDLCEEGKRDRENGVKENTVDASTLIGLQKSFRVLFSRGHTRTKTLWTRMERAGE